MASRAGIVTNFNWGVYRWFKDIVANVGQWFTFLSSHHIDVIPGYAQPNVMEVW